MAAATGFFRSIAECVEFRDEAATIAPVADDLPSLEVLRGQRVYEPDGVALRQFLADRSHVSIIRGPIGSGTSSACCMKIYTLAMEQRRFQGRRRSCWAVVRDSYPNLRATTVKTWLDWFPDGTYGRFFYERPYRHEVRIGDIELDLHFLSLDSDDDIKKLRSIEFTGFWFNELEYTSKSIFDEAESRTGRFPALKDGGTSWDGIIADLNAPNEDHWLPQMMGEVPISEHLSEEDAIRGGRPVNWSYFVQPPAVLEIRSADGRQVTGYRENPDAENRRWLKPGFYEEKCQGKTKAWIDSRLRNKIVYVIDGDPVFSGFNQDTHIAPEPLVPVPGHEVTVGIDFGRSRPAAVLMQVINNRIFIQHEFRRYNMSSTTFAPMLKRFLAQTYAGCSYRMYGDPKGADRGQADERTAYDVFKENGMDVRPAPGIRTNSPITRIAAVDDVLNGAGAMHNGLPRFVLSPVNCATLKAAMCGRYHIKKDAYGDPEPVKDKFSDVADALQYAFLGLGEGRRMIGLDSSDRQRPVMVFRGAGQRAGRLGCRRVD